MRPIHHQFNRLLIFLMLFLLNNAISSASNLSIPDEYMQESNRKLVTGIDLNKVFQRYVDDYENFAYDYDLCGSSMIWKWRVKPDPKDKETRYFWGKKRSQPFYQRYMGMEIGVFSSHRAAVDAALEASISNSVGPDLNEDKSKVNGYTRWDYFDGSDHFFVRDNVFVYFYASEDMNPAKIVQMLDNDLQQGCEGITKGDHVDLPQIVDNEFRTDYSIALNSKETTKLDVIKPLNSKYIKKIWLNHDRRFFSDEFQKNGIGRPKLKWLKDGAVEIYEKGPIQNLKLKAIVCTDRCVMSEVWEKTINISIPDGVQMEP
jgi:hypothetical protein